MFLLYVINTSLWFIPNGLFFFPISIGSIGCSCWLYIHILAYGPFYLFFIFYYFFLMVDPNVFRRIGFHVEAEYILLDRSRYRQLPTGRFSIVDVAGMSSHTPICGGWMMMDRFHQSSPLLAKKRRRRRRKKKLKSINNV